MTQQPRKRARDSAPFMRSLRQKSLDFRQEDCPVALKLALADPVEHPERRDVGWAALGHLHQRAIGEDHVSRDTLGFCEARAQRPQLLEERSRRGLKTGSPASAAVRRDSRRSRLVATAGGARNVSERRPKRMSSPSGVRRKPPCSTLASSSAPAAKSWRTVAIQSRRPLSRPAPKVFRVSWPRRCIASVASPTRRSARWPAPKRSPVRATADSAFCASSSRRRAPRRPCRGRRFRKAPEASPK